MSQINVDTIRSREGIAPSLDKGVIVTGVTTSTEGYFSGNVTIGGTLTYEDVTNQDVIGLITARSGIKIGNDQDATGIGITLGTGAIGDASFAGIVTAATCIKVGDGSWGVGIGATVLGNGNAVFSGIVTASEVSGDGSALTGLANTDFILAEQLTVIGFATVSDTFKVGTAITAHAGIITATSYYGDASNMDNAGISAGKSVALAAFLGC